MFDTEKETPESDTSETTRTAMVLNALERIEEAVNGIAVDEIDVKNFVEVKAHLRNELRAVVNAVKGIKVPDTVKISNFPKQVDIKIPDTVKVSNLSELEAFFKGLRTAIEAIQVNPQVSVNVPDVVVPQITFPDFPTIPAPQVKVEPKVEIDISAILNALEPLGYISDKASHPISVRLSDGRSFLKTMKKIVDTQEKQLYAFASNIAITKDEYKDAEKELNIGSTATNTSATVGIASSEIVSAKNRKSVTVINDSDTVIYIAKGGTAELNKGIRLNANGGAIIINDWNGAISAITSVADKNVTICEVE